jgi:DNA-binding response OmpR family regulator
MTSALSEEAVRQQFSGFQVFLRKPFRIDELLMTVGRILRGP